MSARLLIIGLDGADGRTLDRGSRDGTLPNLTALRARGCTSALTSMLGATDDALWASFQYGTDIGQHGRYSYMVPTGAGELGYAVMQEVDRAAFWDGLSERGLRVAVVDVPKCRLPRSLNGIHLVDWLTHGRYFHPPRSYPDTLVDDIVARFGAAPPSRCDYAQPSPLVDEDVRTVRDNLLRSEPPQQGLKHRQGLRGDHTIMLALLGSAHQRLGVGHYAHLPVAIERARAAIAETLFAAWPPVIRQGNS